MSLMGLVLRPHFQDIVFFDKIWRELDPPLLTPTNQAQSTQYTHHQSEAILPHPPWYRLYTRITDVVWLHHGIIIEHVAAFTRAAEHVRVLALN